VNQITIENVITEIGVDRSVFPDEHHLCAWTGICPGNEESAGKRLQRFLVRRLQHLGFDVTLTKKQPDDQAAA